MAHNFRDAHDRNFRIVRDHVDASRAHLRAAHAKNFHVEALLNFRRQARGIHIAAGFTRRK